MLVHISNLFIKSYTNHFRVQFSSTEVCGFQEQLKAIQATMKERNFVGADGTIPEGQGIVKGLLERCFRWSEIVLDR
jgi:hypothetical protein